MNDTALKAAIGAGLFLLVAIVRAASRNRLVRRRLQLTLLLLIGYLGFVAALWWYPFGADLAARIVSVSQLVLALAFINLVVVTAINPLREDRVPERFPTIVQDTVIIVLFVIVATGVMGEKFLTTSAVGAVVVGFALQDTLGNMFSGLAIQIEKPFRVGHWVAVGNFEGRVTEVTWRATKLRTKSGNHVILPNSFIGKEAIINYSEPEAPTRLDIIVGVSYDVPPDQVKAALQEAVANVPLVLPAPEPDFLVDEFASSSVNYRVRFWIADFARDTAARDQVRSAIYYALKRHRFEIPYPMQVEYSRDETPERPADRLARADAILRAADLFASLPEDSRKDLASRSIEQMFGAGEAIVREGDPGSSLFVVARGRARVVHSSGRELATFSRGGYFGEMSLLTGQPRSANVLAVDECLVLELTADALRQSALVDPEVLRRIGTVVAERRADLEHHRTEAAAERLRLDDSKHSFFARVQEFFGLPNLFKS
jgi:small-conductance mechanosensitive channel/CRP-like cAMP-binding protein